MSLPNSKVSKVNFNLLGFGHIFVNNAHCSYMCKNMYKDKDFRPARSGERDINLHLKYRK